jgi:hypothetical protein
MIRPALLAATMLAVSASAGSANTLLADTVLEFFDSGSGPQAGPYGGTFSPANFPVPVPLGNATDGDANTFVSLPTGSFLTLGFSGGFVFDGPGNDIFIEEPGDGNENADVFVSSDGISFTFLGQAFGAQLTELDLGAIGFTDPVTAVRIVGLDNGGSSPGFDVAFVEGLEGSVVIDPVTVAPALPLLASAIAGLAVLRRRAR